ncbi:hypothetical protein [Deinococcus hopiensis]|uniref:hypothetical protein n=1 Tax=Deinococcus hopiensis TaxID=309885 RepID=UPI000A066AC9|nr:hypothetical protein [Deinococcus hopiensis]
MRTAVLLAVHTEEKLTRKTEARHDAPRGVAALAADGNMLPRTRRRLDIGELAQLYGFTGLTARSRSGTRTTGGNGRRGSAGTQNLNRVSI